MSAVNREFVYIDFDNERFPPCEEGEEVTEGPLVPPGSPDALGEQNQ